MKIFPLNEGVYTIDKTKIFVPFDIDRDKLQERPTGSLLVEIQPFLVVTEKDILLLDTGLGFSVQGEYILHKNLARYGFQPHHITKVLVTHLHKDHAGGISIKNKLEHDVLAFPNALYYLQRSELEDAEARGFPSYIWDELQILHSNTQVVSLSGNGVIDNYIHYELTGGHSPFHQVFKIVENSQTVFFGGDEAPQLQQMKNRFVAKYDFDGKKAMNMRQEWWRQGNLENWQFLFYHDIAHPVWPPLP
jgi:glyoxylase-like metal-dependent hydrolase (beta-lactamase superfamily II)